MLTPCVMMSGRAQYPTVLLCACTKGCPKVYEKKGSWSAITDHLFLAHGITKDSSHPTVLNKQTKDTRDRGTSLGDCFLSSMSSAQNSEPQ